MRTPCKVLYCLHLGTTGAPSAVPSVPCNCSLQVQKPSSLSQAARSCSKPAARSVLSLSARLDLVGALMGSGGIITASIITVTIRPEVQTPQNRETPKPVTPELWPWLCLALLPRLRWARSSKCPSLKVAPRCRLPLSALQREPLAEGGGGVTWSRKSSGYACSSCVPGRLSAAKASRRPHFKDSRGGESLCAGAGQLPAFSRRFAVPPASEVPSWTRSCHTAGRLREVNIRDKRKDKAPWRFGM